MTIQTFCEAHSLPLPKRRLLFVPRPARADEAGLFYAMSPEKDAEFGAIGHVRMDFGGSGDEFWHAWWSRGPEELNTPEFKEELDKVVDELREGPLKSLKDMRRWYYEHGGEIEGGICGQNYGYVIETENYKYLLRCNPVPGDYQAYLNCFDRRVQEMNMGQESKPSGMTMEMGGM